MLMRLHIHMYQYAILEKQILNRSKMFQLLFNEPATLALLLWILDKNYMNVYV